MDERRPAVERVPARRSLPIAVGVVVLVFVATLAWQPWSDRSVAPTPTALPVAAATASPDTSAPEESGTARLASPSPGPLPTPDLGPLGPAGTFEMTAGPRSAVVECQYSPFRDGRRFLRAMSVHPPTVTAFNDDRGALDVRSIAWRVEIQANRLDVVFDHGWATVARSRSQVARPAAGSSAALFPMYVEYNVPRDEATSVLRALVIVEWYTRNLELAGRVEHLASSYLELSGPGDVIRPEGCHGASDRFPGRPPRRTNRMPTARPRDL